MVDLTAPLKAYGFEPGITHMDLCERGARAPLESLITECVLIDLTTNPEEAAPGHVPELDLVQRGCSVILRTGWAKHRGTPRYADSPSVNDALVHALVDRGVVLILVDAPGVRGGASGAEHNATDRYLARHGAYAVENLVNVDELPAGRAFRLYCFPIQLTERNTAPCRVIADVS